MKKLKIRQKSKSSSNDVSYETPKQIPLNVIKSKLMGYLDRLLKKLALKMGDNHYAQEICSLQKHESLDKVIEVMETIIHSLYSQSNNDVNVKSIKIKSGERKILRVLKQDDQVKGRKTGTQIFEKYERELEGKNSEIFELLQRNKKLQRKVLIISSEYFKNKVELEEEVERLKLILNNSLIEMKNLMKVGEREQDPVVQEFKKELRRYTSQQNLNVNKGTNKRKEGQERWDKGCPGAYSGKSRRQDVCFSYKDDE